MATQKQMFETIMTACAETPEIVEFCEKQIEKLSKRAPRTYKPSKATLERREAVLTFMQEHATECMTATEVAQGMGFEKAASVVQALKFLVSTEQVEEIQGEKKSHPSQYQLA